MLREIPYPAPGEILLEEFLNMSDIETVLHLKQR
jgi:hypothetical protein